MSQRAAVMTLTAGLCAVAGASAVAATAPTITVTNPQRCFVNTFASTPSGTGDENYANIHIAGAGWHAGAEVQLDFAGNIDEAESQAQSDGTFRTSFQLPDPDLGREYSPTYGSALVIAVDYGDGDTSDLGGSIAITKKVAYTDRQVNVWEDDDDVYGQRSVFHPSDPVYFKASGFTPDKPVYAHYLHNGSSYSHPGKLITTVNLGTASGACGTVNHRGRIFPFTPPKADRGDYTIAYSSSRAYVARTTQYVWQFRL